MRLYNKILLAAVAVSSMTMTSCLKDQKDIFCDEPSVRLQKVMDNCQKVLCSSENGWIMEYYPDRDKTYGGFVYGLKFTPAEVTVTCELAPGDIETSYYKMTDDNGPVLSFDTYNTFMHFFATPSSNKYEAYDGDFEFIVLDVTDDLITLKGNRTGNIIYMHRAASDPVQYVADAAEMGDNMFPTMYEGTLGSEQISAFNSLNDRYLEFTVGEGEPVGEYYVPTPTGLHFYNPVTINGATFTDLAFNADTYVFTGTADNGTTMTITGSLPATYSFYNEYIGDFLLSWSSGTRTLNVSIADDGTGRGYTITGMSNKFTVHGDYDKSNGCMSVYAQPVDMNGSLTVFIAAWDLVGGGNLTWSTDVGMSFVKDPDHPGTFVREPIVSSTGISPDSFITWYINGSSSAGQAAAPYTFANGSTQLPYITSIVKK